jgi:hypothetical protein
VTTTRSHESEQPVSRNDFSGVEEIWIRTFVERFEEHALDASRDLPPDAGVSDSQVATARAILETFLESGMELESVVELLGRVAMDWRHGRAPWSEALNERRFALIDKEMQGSLTPSESIELAGLTRIMRDHAESQENLPIEGVRALHRKLLQLEPTGVSE